MSPGGVSPRLVRWTVVAVFVVGVAGMIAGSVADNNGIAITFGLTSAMAALSLILITSVLPAGAFRRGATDEVLDEEAARGLESRIERLVGAGGDEHEIRVLVRDAVEFGRAKADGPAAPDERVGETT